MASSFFYSSDLCFYIDGKLCFMRKLVTPVFLLGLCIFSYAQETVFQYQPTSAEDKKSASYLSYVVADQKTASTTILVKNDNSVDYLLLGDDFSLKEKLQSKGGINGSIFKFAFFKYLAGVTNNLGTCFFYSVKDKDWNDGQYHIRMELVDFKNKTVSNKMVFEIPKGESTVDWYTIDGKFVLFTANDKEKQFVFHIINEDGKKETKYVDVNLTGFNKDKLSVSEYFSYSHVFSANEQTELTSATDLNKIYVFPDKLEMVVTNQNEPPHIWTVDTRTYKLTGRKIDMQGFVGLSGKKEKFYNNSTLYGSNLYVLHNSKNKIELGVFDFASGKLLKKHEISEESTLPFLETPVEIINKGRLTKKNTITSNKELTKELFKGSAGLAIASITNDQLKLTCGVYDKENRATSGHYAGGFTQGSRSTGGTYAGSNVPVMRTYSSFNSMANYREGASYTYTRTVNFQVILDASHNISKTSKTQSEVDKINTFIEAIEDKSQAQNLFRKGSNSFISYYSTGDKTFYVKQIKL